MFESLKKRDDFNHLFKAVEVAIVSSEMKDAELAKNIALEILKSKHRQFRHELNNEDDAGTYEEKLNSFEHAMDVLQRYFDGNPGGLTQDEARVYSQYLQNEHATFMQLADDLSS